MPFDEGLAERVREVVSADRRVTERKMFGGLAIICRGYMFVGILGHTLMARVGPAEYERVLARPYVRPMDFTGKPMNGYVFVDPPGLEDDADLAGWVEECRRFVLSLPPRKELA